MAQSQQNSDALATQRKERAAAGDTGSFRPAGGVSTGLTQSRLQNQLDAGQQQTNDVLNPDSATLDLTSPPDLGAIEALLTTVGTKQGEGVSLGLKIEAGAKINRATIDLMGKLGVVASRAETGSLALEFNAEAALELGVDLKLAKGSIRGSVDGKVKAYFASKEDAAQWLADQLYNMNTPPGRDEGVFFQEPASGRPNYQYKLPFIETEVAGSLEAKGKVEFPDVPGPVKSEVELAGGIKYRYAEQSFTRDGKPAGSGKSHTFEAGFEGKAALPIGRGKSVDATIGYKFTQTEQRGSALPDFNGTFRKQELTFELTASQIRDTDASVLASSLLAAAAKKTGITQDPASAARLQQSLQRQLGLLKNLGFSGQNSQTVGITVENNEKREEDFAADTDKFDHRSTRVFVRGGVEQTRGFNVTDALKASATVSVDKTFQLTEVLGTETESYLQMRFNTQYNGDPNDPAWKTLVADNQDTFKSLIDHNIANNPGGAVARAYADGHFEAGLDAMLKMWTLDADQMRETITDGRAVAEMYFSRERSIGDLNAFNGQEREQIKALVDKYKDNPRLATFFYDQMIGYGVREGKLKSDKDLKVISQIARDFRNKGY